MSTPATETRRKRKGRKNLLAGFSATVEEQSALDQYLRDVSRHELITPEREKELMDVIRKEAELSGIRPDHVEALFHLVLAESRAVQELRRD